MAQPRLSYQPEAKQTNGEDEKDPLETSRSNCSVCREQHFRVSDREVKPRHRLAKLSWQEVDLRLAGLGLLLMAEEK